MKKKLEKTEIILLVIGGILLVAIVLMLVFGNKNANNRDINNNTSINENKDKSEDDETLDENDNLDEENEDDNEEVNDDDKDLEELMGKIKKNDIDKLTKNEKDKIIKVINNYFANINNLHSVNYCDDVDFEKYLEVDGEYYYLVKNYNSYKDIKNYFNTTVSDQFIIDNSLDKEFIEKDNKLYCHIIPRGACYYSNNSFKLIKVEKNSNSIYVIGSYLSSCVGDDLNTNNVYIELVSNNNNYVINTYEEY